MNLELFTKIQRILSEKYKLLDNVIYNKDELFLLSIRQTICEIFLNKWLDSPESDPIDILDNMIVIYYIYLNSAKEFGKLKLLVVYSTYIRTLTFIKNLIKKETI